MASDLIRKLIDETINLGGTYAEFALTTRNIAFTSDAGTRRSTRNYKLDDKTFAASETVLKQINETCLLFTGELKRIKVVLQDGREARFERKDEGQFSIVRGRRVTESRIKEYIWVRFTDENDCRCGVAFAIKNTKNKKHILPCIGSIRNGFFDSGITTDLLFVISGDFYGKSSLPDSKYKSENQCATEKVGRVLENAIISMLQLRLIGIDLYTILPSTLDDDSDLNMAMIQATKRAFANRPMILTRKGTIVGKNKTILGSEEVTALFPQEIIERFFEGKYWTEKCAEGSREEYFLIDLGLTYYDRERFLLFLFEDDNLDEVSALLATQKEKWLRQFYIFCSKPIAETRVRRQVITALKNIRSIRDSRGKMYFPFEISLAAEDSDTTRKSVVVKKSLICPGNKEDEYSNQIRDFFINDLNIKGFSLVPELEQMAEDMMKKKQPIDRLYCEKLLTLAKFDADNPGRIDFNNYAIFPYESARGIGRAKAEELVIGKPYIKEGDLIATALKRKTIWKGLNKLLSKDDLDLILRFVENNGAVGKPRIIKQKAENHVSFSEHLFASGKQGNRDSNYDYTIVGLDDMLRRKSVRLIQLVWIAITEYDDSVDVLHAEYSVDNRMIVKRDDSSLIKILRKRTWVPAKDGKFYMPGNIEVTDIREDFKYNRRNPILKELQFGSNLKENRNNLEIIKKTAIKEGLRLISEEEYQEFLRWKTSKKK